MSIDPAIRRTLHWPFSNSLPQGIADPQHAQTTLTRAMDPAKPLVGVIMGSDSDLPCMSAACAKLKEFGVPFEVDIVSAHRTPDKLVSYSRSAHERGLEVVIAGAGGAAHLPGMVAAMTPLPVIGVPVKTSVRSPNPTPPHPLPARPCPGAATG